MNEDLNKFTTEELGKLFPITIEEYNPEWRNLFEQEKINIIRILGKEISLRIEHFGSTAIPNILAKPTIDILVEIPTSLAISNEIIQRMKNYNYNYILRNDCPPPYMMFVKGYTHSGFVGQCYHIHMGPAYHDGLWDRLYFRDYLIENMKELKEYENLKNSLSKKYKYDREKYTEGKKEFINRITNIAKKYYTNNT